MLSITPSSFHFYLEKWRKRLDSFDDKNKKDRYAQKISSQLRDFANNAESNALVPYVKALLNKLSNKSMNADIIIKVLNQLEKDDNNLMV